VIGVGDITDDNIPEQWEKASTAFAGLEGKVKHFPVLGNHDVSTSYGGDDPELFKQYLIFEQDENNGSFDGSMKSYFYRFEIQGQKYLFLGLGYVPSQEELDWAKTVLEAHPDHNVILSCHGYLDDDGTPLTHSGAPEIREQLVLPYSNVVLVLCGHMHNENVLLYTEVREDRTTVQALLTNPQEYNYDVNLGIVTGLYFTNGGRTVHVANHVAGYDAYLGADSVRSFELDLLQDRVTD
ncbi:MAG: metallophosphoesterase, partial [Clostridia bacterium]|nr:metallophosphoesterase [Clostridia bacterium]